MTAASAPHKGSGWLIFAGVVMFIAGAVNVVDGVGAISDSKFYAHHGDYIVGSLHTWGWVHLVLGALLICVVFGVWARAPWATYVGIFIVSLNAISRLLALPSYPLLSIALFGVDLLIIYALAVYGVGSRASESPR
jgi:hypothetical protein